MKRESIKVVRYSACLKDIWDNFVEESRNGTFLHKRAYMEYHSDRFCDYSMLFYCGDRPIALLPANITDEAVVSHGGLTYGGLIMGNDATAERVLEIFDVLKEHLAKETNAKRLLYRPVPHIYHSYPCEEDLYALFRNNALLIERKISTTIKISRPLPFKGRRKMTAAAKSRLHIVEENNLADFWRILEERLMGKYGVAPVHTLQEIELLHSLFPQNILLLRVTDNSGTTLGGVVIYIVGRVAHTQYIGATDEGRRIGALDHLYEYLISDRFSGFEYFDFGVSTEQGGHYLNSGLIAHKERLGGRATIYDTYAIEIKRVDNGKEEK